MRWKTLERTAVITGKIDRDLLPHEVLGVSASASEHDIKAAYRLKVKAYHPDLVDAFLRPHAEEMVKLVNGAYRTMLVRHRR